ncbi:ATP-grasp domain-containing protein [Sporosarcina sp. FSL K6-1508]|uniref:ATP-grasp domain-containing protein n=1 Tax=Sporosarcina sp. FSL K6-1508 TaxID=2921553 RepID=UPI0030F6A7A7
MRILFSHSYRTGLISKQNKFLIEIMCYEDASNDDIQSADKIYYTTRKNRMKDLLNIIELDPPDIVILNGAMDNECLEEVSYRESIIKKGIKVFGHSEEATKLCFNKKDTINFLKKIHIPTIPSPNLKEGDKILPVVAKPPESWEGYGIKILTTMNEVQLITDDYVLEKFIKGVELSVQAICNKDSIVICPPVYKGVTSLKMVHPLKKLRVFPNPWNEEINNSIIEASSRIARELNTEGIIDIDFIIQEDTFFVTEINCRASGVTRMVSLGGINAYDIILQILNGKKFDLLPLVSFAVEVPIRYQLNDNEVELLMNLDFVDYIFIRPDGNGLRQRVLLKGETLDEIGMHVKEIFSLIAIDEPELEEILTLCEMRESYE